MKMRFPCFDPLEHAENRTNPALTASMVFLDPALPFEEGCRTRLDDPGGGQKLYAHAKMHGRHEG